MAIDQEFIKFIRKEREKSIKWLSRNYGSSNLREEDFEDIFSKSVLIVWEKIQEGSLNETNLTCSLSTYILSICKNQALKVLQGIKSVSLEAKTDDEESGSLIDILPINGESYEDEYDEEKEAQLQLMERLITELPHPCSEILWGFYRDRLSMEDLANELGYNNATTMKVKKNQCQNKLKERFTNIWNSQQNK